MDTRIIVNVVVIPLKLQHRAFLEPLAPFDKIKNDLVNGFNEKRKTEKKEKIGDPSDFKLAIAPKDTRQAPQAFTIAPDDWVYLIRKDDTEGPAAGLVD